MLQFVEVSDEREIIVYPDVLDDLIVNLVKTGSIVVVVAYYLAAPADGVAYQD